MKYLSGRIIMWDDDGPALTGQTVIVESDEPLDTGLVDHTGTKIYRVAGRLPIGFRIKS